MRRVVVTGLGVVSSIGNSTDEVFAPTVNLEQIAPECDGVSHVQSTREAPLRTAMTFNAGLGGSNAWLVFRKP